MFGRLIIGAATLLAAGSAAAQAGDTHPMGQSGNPSGATAPGLMGNDAMGDKTMDHQMMMDDGVTMMHGKWIKNSMPATKTEIAEHKKMMAEHKNMMAPHKGM